MIPYQPLGNRIILKAIPITEEDRKQGDIILAETAIIFQKAEVVRVGRGEVAGQTGEVIPMEVSEGSMVLIRTEAPHLPLKINGEEYRLMRENDIEAIVEK